MKRILAVIAAFAIMGAAALTAANAQGVGVQVGPIGAGVGVGPYGYGDGRYHQRDYGYASDCRVIRQRTETPSGRVIVRSRRVCG
jgi:opacity protein-like surface antigen